MEIDPMHLILAKINALFAGNWADGYNSEVETCQRIRLTTWTKYIDTYIHIKYNKQ